MGTLPQIQGLGSWVMAPPKNTEADMVLPSKSQQFLQGPFEGFFHGGHVTVTLRLQIMVLEDVELRIWFGRAGLGCGCQVAGV